MKLSAQGAFFTHNVELFRGVVGVWLLQAATNNNKLITPCKQQANNYFFPQNWGAGGVELVVGCVCLGGVTWLWGGVTDGN